MDPHQRLSRHGYWGWELTHPYAVDPAQLLRQRHSHGSSLLTLYFCRSWVTLRAPGTVLGSGWATRLPVAFSSFVIGGGQVSLCYEGSSRAAARLLLVDPPSVSRDARADEVASISAFRTRDAFVGLSTGLGVGAGVFFELSDDARVVLDEPRHAVAGLLGDEGERPPLPEQQRHERTPEPTDGRYWARTSDLRLVEAERRGLQRATHGTKGSYLEGNREWVADE